MLIQGSNLTEDQIVDYLETAKHDETCDNLDFREIDFDYEPCRALVEALQAKQWKSIRFSLCSGYINDVVTACMSSKVESFYLQSRLTTQTVFALGYGLKYSPALQELSLSVVLNDIELAHNLARALARNTKLKSLSLSGSTLPAAAIGPIGFAFRLNRTLERFSFDACYLEDPEVASLLTALQDHPTLKFLSLQQNSCHDEGMSAIAALLHYNDLQELDLSYLIRKKKTEKPPTPPPEEEPEEKEDENEDGEKGHETKDESDDKKDDNKSQEEEGPKDSEDKKEEKQEEASEEETKVEKSDNKVRNKSLKVIQLAGNGLSDDFLDSILGIFGKGSALEQLNIFGNRFTDRGVRMILAKLPELTQLKSLWLGHNCFSPLAAKCLVEALRTNFILEDINIRTLDNDPSWDTLQQDLDHYARLNRGGRRIFSSGMTNVPLGLWPLILERANRIYWGGTTSNASNETVKSHAADSIFSLLHGPALFANPCLPTQTYKHVTNYHT